MNHRRLPAVAGRFYPADERACLAELAELLGGVEPSSGVASSEGRALAGVVPHAGWMFSGAVAGRVLRAIGARVSPTSVVVFGADHWLEGSRIAKSFPDGAWTTPLGDAEIDTELVARLSKEGTGLIETSVAAHRREHSIEVQIPLIQSLWPRARIVPILVGPSAHAQEVGRLVGHVTRDRDDVIAIGSSDLTHYGPSYELTSHGRGRAALTWVKETNDAAIVDAMTAMRADEVLAEASRHANACGPGAIAAAISFAREHGASHGRLIAYTTSHDVHPRGEPSDFVGYAGVVFEAVPRPGTSPRSPVLA